LFCKHCCYELCSCVYHDSGSASNVDEVQRAEASAEEAMTARAVQVQLSIVNIRTYRFHFIGL
jgi:hypothetical protein